MRVARWVVPLAALIASSAFATEETSLMVERAVTLDELPAAVRSTILEEADGAELTEIEEITIDDVRRYEAEWIVGDTEFEVLVSADGEVLGRDSESVVDGDDDDDHDDDDDGDEDDGAPGSSAADDEADD